MHSQKDFFFGVVGWGCGGDKDFSTSFKMTSSISISSILSLWAICKFPWKFFLRLVVCLGPGLWKPSITDRKTPKAFHSLCVTVHLHCSS